MGSSRVLGGGSGVLGCDQRRWKLSFVFRHRKSTSTVSEARRRWFDDLERKKRSGALCAAALRCIDTIISTFGGGPKQAKSEESKAASFLILWICYRTLPKLNERPPSPVSLEVRLPGVYVGGCSAASADDS